MRFSPMIERIAGRGALAWEIHHQAVELTRAGADIVFLTVGEPDFDTPTPVVEAAVSSLRAGNTHYTDIVGYPELRQAVADWHQRTTGQQVAAEQVVVAPGAQNALFSAMQLIVGPGDEVITTDPCYSTYEAVIGSTGARRVLVPLLPDRGFHLDLEALAAAITPRTRALLLNSPHNPTGAVISRDEMEAIAALCRQHDLWLVSDEVYAALSFDQPHVSPASLPGMAERTVVVSSLSKSHAMSGWRVGWVVGPVSLAKHLHNLFLCMLYGSPGFIQDAALVALNQVEDEVTAMREAYRRRRDLVTPWLDRLPGLACRKCEGGMFAMADVRATGLSSMDFARALLAEEKVAVLPGDGFGQQAEGFVRISLGLPEAALSEACARIESFALRLSEAGTRRRA